MQNGRLGLLTVAATLTRPFLRTEDIDAGADTLVIEVFDDDVGADDELGVARVPLAGVFEARELSLWLDLEDQGGRNTHAGEVHIRFAYEAPADSVAAEFDTASAKLGELQESLREAKREQRLLRGGDGEDDGHKRLSPPDEEPYRLLLHVYQGKQLPPADGNGTSDPYLRASIAGQSKETSRKTGTLFPHWFETLSFTLQLPSREHIQAGLAPELILQLFDHDRLNPDDFMGRCSLSLTHATAAMPDSPGWVPLRLLDTNAPAGQLLVSLQLINLNTDQAALSRGIPRTIKPAMRRCTIELMLLGCRDLKAYNYREPVAPFVKFSLNGDTGVAGQLMTKPQNLPAATDPNYLQILKISCHIPVDPIFSPTLDARVYDKRFGGMREPLLGTAVIELRRYLPWIQKNRDRIIKRQSLNAEQCEATIGNNEPEPEPDMEPEPEPEAGDSVEAAMAARQARVGKLNSEPSALSAQASQLGDVTFEASTAPAPQEEEAEALLPSQSFVSSRAADLPVPDSAAAEEPEQEDEEDDLELPAWKEGRLIGQGGKVLDNELEDEMLRWHNDGVERQPFDLWPLERNAVGLALFGSGVQTTSTAGQYGFIKGLIRIVDNSGAELSTIVPTDDAPSSPETSRRRSKAPIKERTRSGPAQGSSSLPFPLSLSELLRPTPVVVRCYVIRAFGLSGMDSGHTSDPYLVCRLGTEEQGSEDDRVPETLDPYFGRCYEFESVLPGPSQLEITVHDYDALGGDDEIGRTTVDLEDRFFGSEWKAMAKKPLERRTLRLEGSKVARGKVELWVDIMPKALAATTPKFDIGLAPPSSFELRCVIWRARSMPAMDIMTNANDLFFTTHLSTADNQGRKPTEATQETDVHWRSHKGKGSFNWRCVFDVELPQHARSPARLAIKAWDKDPVTFSNDLIGAIELNLDRLLFKPGLRKYNAYRRWEGELEAMDEAQLRNKIAELGEVKMGGDVKAPIAVP